VCADLALFAQPRLRPGERLRRRIEIEPRSNLARNHEEYLGAIDRALAEDSADLRARRMNAVAGASWDTRFRETVAVVDQFLAKAKP